MQVLLGILAAVIVVCGVLAMAATTEPTPDPRPPVGEPFEAEDVTQQFKPRTTPFHTGSVCHDRKR